MPQEEKYGNRRLTYSAWHRSASTRRFVGSQTRALAMIDLDHILWIEYEDTTKWPLALIEEAEDVGQDQKPSTVTENLATMARLPALVVLWKPGSESNPADPQWPDIEGFRVKRICPGPRMGWRIMTPEEYAQMLLRMRTYRVDKLDEALFGDVA